MFDVVFHCLGVGVIGGARVVNWNCAVRVREWVCLMRKDRFKLAFTGNDLPLFIAGSGVDVGVKGFKTL